MSAKKFQSFKLLEIKKKKLVVNLVDPSNFYFIEYQSLVFHTNIITVLIIIVIFTSYNLYHNLKQIKDNNNVVFYSMFQA